MGTTIKVEEQDISIMGKIFRLIFKDSLVHKTTMVKTYQLVPLTSLGR